MLSINTVQSNPVNTDTEGSTESVRIDYRDVPRVMLSINTLQSNPVNTDTEGPIESVCIKRVSVLTSANCLRVMLLK